MDGGAGQEHGEATPVGHVDPEQVMDGSGVGQEDGEATPARVDPEEAMDGEATPAPPPTFDFGDLVTWKSAGEHGDRGIVIYMVDTPEDKLPVLFASGAVVQADPGDLAVVDRSYMRPGDMVVSASDPGGQVGVVVAVDTSLDLVAFDGGAAVVVSRDVSPGSLRCVTDLALGDYVLSGAWLGRVVELAVEVDVLFDDGAACRVRSPEGKLWFAGADRGAIFRTDRCGVFCPGQRVEGRESVFQAARWVHGHWKRDGHVEGIVARVELASVVVSWVAARHLGAKLDGVQAADETPPHQQNPRDLTFVFSDNGDYWGVADRCFFRDPGRSHEPPTLSTSTTTTAGDIADVAESDHHHLPTAVAPTDSSGGGGGGGGDHGMEASEAAGDDLSWVGHVVDLCDAYIQVKWGDGNTSKVLPHEIELVEELDVDVMQDAMGEGDWVEDGDDATEEEAQEDDDKKEEPDTATAAVRYQRDSSVGEEEEEEEVVDAPASCGDEGVNGSDENEKAAAGDVASGNDDGSSHFTQFDVVQQCPPDHHFLEDVEQGASGGNKWAKRVQKEWKILQNNLPDTIYVRAYEDRMDLLRAAMVGAAGTPYQDGLFFFDVQLPSSYPSSPPQVYYHSFGLRVNPNLDVSGTVCLSLLDTYDDGGEGGDETHWSPATSTVLQVLVSIQGLVLTAQPYYNESSYETQLGTPGGARNALPYAENACLQALRTLLHLLRRSPAGFEDLVAGHFRRRGRLVLRACEAYLKGCAVGTLDAEACAATPESAEQRPCSPGMRIALAAVVPRLVEAFAGIGADGCEQLFEQLRMQLGGAGVTTSVDLASSTETH